MFNFVANKFNGINSSEKNQDIVDNNYIFSDKKYEFNPLHAFGYIKKEFGSVNSHQNFNNNFGKWLSNIENDEEKNAEIKCPESEVFDSNDELFLKNKNIIRFNRIMEDMDFQIDQLNIKILSLEKKENPSSEEIKEKERLVQQVVQFFRDKEKIKRE